VGRDVEALPEFEVFSFKSAGDEERLMRALAPPFEDRVGSAMSSSPWETAREGNEDLPPGLSRSSGLTRLVGRH
jgi:hypothetical protein